MNNRMKRRAAVAAGVVLLAQAARGIAAAHPNCPGPGDCCVDNGTPGCDDEDCCNYVCDALDPFCCDQYWDAVCANTAVDVCSICSCCCWVNCPPDALNDGEPCGADTNGGCHSTPPVFTMAACGDTFCGSAWASEGARDTDWYLVEHLGGTLTAEVVSEFPAVCLILDGIPACAPVVVGVIGCGEWCDDLSIASASLPAGQYVVFVAPGHCDGSGVFEDWPCFMDMTDYVLDIACEPCPGDCEDAPDGIVGIVDFLALLAQWGMIDTCDFDGDGVSVTDFLILLANWGPCP